MAQEVMIQGAIFSSVPSIKVPDSHNVFHSFHDVSDTTATASDVAQGKYFYSSDGTRTLGTKTDQGVSVTETLDSHGGTIIEIAGATVKPIQKGVLRPDAELVESWTMDKYAVADLGLTIPSYSTTAQTIKATENIATYTGTPTSYRYIIIQRCLTTPIYSIATLAKGREEYCYSVAGYEWVYQPSGQLCTLDGTKSYGQYSQFCATGAFTREVLWNSATAMNVYTSPAYCLAQNLQAPVISANKTITIKSPTITIRGHSSYLTQTFFEAITDARIQYKIELYRVPADTSVVGWTIGSQMQSLYEDIANNNGTLR